MKIVAAIPAYNEARYIGSVVLETRRHIADVFVYDDGSTDNTSGLARMAGAIVLKGSQNQGKGFALRSLVKAVKGQCDCVVFLDGDGQHDPSEIPALINAVMDGADLAIGSRNGHIPAHRRIGQRVLSVASQTRIHDTESGFRALSKRMIECMDLHEDGFAIEAEEIIQAREHKLTVVEVPVKAIYGEGGHTRHFLEHGLSVLARILVMVSERRPLLYFGVSGALVVVGGMALAFKVLDTFTRTNQLAVGYSLLAGLLVIIGLMAAFNGLILNALVKMKGGGRSKG